MWFSELDATFVVVSLCSLQFGILLCVLVAVQVLQKNKSTHRQISELMIQ